MSTSLTLPTTGGPSLPQERRLVTALPGPRSAELLARKAAAVAAGVGHTVPIHAVAAGGGVVVDADGNSLIDLGSGIAVTSVGNAHPAVVAAVLGVVFVAESHALWRRARTTEDAVELKEQARWHGISISI